jgi:hypothetical protein
VLNAAFIPMVYCFYPETKGITVCSIFFAEDGVDLVTDLNPQLEDIPLLFAKGGVTGGVLTSKGGRTVIPGQHAHETYVEEKTVARRLEGEGEGEFAHKE